MTRFQGYTVTGFRPCFCLLVLATSWLAQPGLAADKHNRIRIRDPKSGKVYTVKCERIPLGKNDDYKASIVVLPNQRLLLSMFMGKRVGGGKILEQTVLYGSADGGKTWSKRRVLSTLGREPYLSVSKSGTVFITAHLLKQDKRNRDGYTHSYLHRSDDGGKNWTSLKVQPKLFRPKTTALISRNVLQLADGSLVFGISEHAPNSRSVVYRSTNEGKSWQTYPSHFEGVPKKYPYTLFGEAHLWQARSGKVITILRVGAANSWPIRGTSDPGNNDQSERMIVYSTTNLGKSWQKGPDLGTYGQMYMALLPVGRDRILLTFTQRAIAKQLGIRAVLGRQLDDGFHFDMKQKNHIMIETRTPPGTASGGGFGPTVRLADGTLVTSYTYRLADGSKHAEVVRWRLPKLD